MRVILLLICLSTCVPVCLSQSNETVKPDLTGTWELVPHQKGEELSPPQQIKITHHDPKLIIRGTVQAKAEPEERELIYYTDGRGERNTTGELTIKLHFESWEPTETESKTIWSKDKIVTRSAEQSFSGAAIVVYEIVDEWKLSSDGKTLARTTTTKPKKDVSGNAAYGDGFEFKRVYKLIPR
jgi:hypothetical protein